jgi:hypothetical protein
MWGCYGTITLAERKGWCSQLHNIGSYKELYRAVVLCNIG